MTQRYRHRGRVDVYEPVPPKDNSWIGGALLIFVVLALLAQCSH